MTPRPQAAASVHALEGAEEGCLVTPRLEATASVHALDGGAEEGCHAFCHCQCASGTGNMIVATGLARPGQWPWPASFSSD